MTSKIFLIAIILGSLNAYSGRWKYDESVDKMRNEKSFYAVLPSDNSIEFKFPYNGGSNLLITLGKKGKNSSMAMLSITKGQFSNLNGNTLSAKFDKNKIESFEFIIPKNSKRNVLFISDLTFVEKIKKSKKLTLEVPFYGDGSRQFEFDSSDLNWKHN